MVNFSPHQQHLAQEIRTTLRPFRLTLAVTAGAYSSGDVVGGRLKLGGLGVPPGFWLNRIVISDKAAQSVDYRLIIFDAAPTVIADNAAISTLADADAAKVIFDRTLDAATYRLHVTNSSWHIMDGMDEALVADPTGGVDLYAYLVAVTAPTYASGSDVSLYLVGTG